MLGEIAWVIGGAALGAVFSHLTPGLVERFRISREAAPLAFEGRWQCAWYKTTGQGREVLYEDDHVVLRRSGLWDVAGTGHGSEGDYQIEGRVCQDYFAFRYHNEDKSLLGGGIVCMDPRRTECEGNWCGFVVEQLVISGRVEWTRD